MKWYSYRLWRLAISPTRAPAVFDERGYWVRVVGRVFWLRKERTW